ncbi:glucose 1-dehydrogenase [Ornithinibacillus sp. L9]|uniref:Glucose 1-dehydrogenase n=1 Tax=Ornithinibacillus caprae TaxID=2678566 RepID=A0A6N8FMG9_9BACI|nr:glucose 1-dehydrogenase [Ornithinibacillus caprae]MUK90533.1 glucose 1-dehydrogenase [Ornithinibacillus caprae]
MELQGKIAVVTGGASGIGLATVKTFVEKGAKVVIADFDEQNGMQAESALRETGADVLFVKVDVSIEEAVESLIAETVKTYGKIDIIVNNAGVGILGEAHEMTYEEYQKVISINQDGVFFGAKYAIREMLKTGGGVIINTSSILGSVGEPGAFPYNASKGAVNLMTKSLALQYANRGIRVNAVAPGYVESGMVNKEALGDFYDNLVAKHPVGRLGNPEEIAHAVVFLCENEFVTGTTILVDGGYTAQ